MIIIRLPGRRELVMNKELITYFEKQISLINTSITGDEIRNDIFKKMHPYIDVWVKSLLRRYGEYVDVQERLSLCWDCFLFSLRHYRPERKINVPRHFYSYTRFFFLARISKQNKEKKIKIDQPDLNDGVDLVDLEIIYEQLEELTKFREFIPDNYQKIFDDALLSMAGSPRDKVCYVKSDAYSQYKYREAKKAFRFVIAFLLQRDD